MARHLSPPEVQILTRHLDQVGIVRCPVCAHENFEIIGMEAAANVLINTQNASLSGDVMPTVAMICVNCYYVLRFAWLPIARKGAANG